MLFEISKMFARWWWCLMLDLCNQPSLLHSGRPAVSLRYFINELSMLWNQGLVNSIGFLNTFPNGFWLRSWSSNKEKYQKGYELGYEKVHMESVTSFRLALLNLPIGASNKQVTYRPLLSMEWRITPLHHPWQKCTTLSFRDHTNRHTLPFMFFDTCFSIHKLIIHFNHIRTFEVFNTTKQRLTRSSCTSHESLFCFIESPGFPRLISSFTLGYLPIGS